MPHPHSRNGRRSVLFDGRHRPSTAIAILIAVFCTLVSHRGLALDPSSNPSDYILSSWDVEDGLPHDTIRCFAQTPDGYMWIGTQRGLARFDGLRFTVFDSANTPEMPADRVTTLIATGDGDLWVGTSSGLLHYRDGRFRGYRQGSEFKIGTVNALCIGPDGTLYVGGREGLGRKVGDAFVFDLDVGKTDLLGLHSMHVDRSHALWVAIGNEVFRISSGRLKVFAKEEGLPNAPVQQLLSDRDGALLAVTQNGLYRLSNERFQVVEQSRAFASQRLGCVLLDQSGTMWVGSTGGLDRVSDGKVAHSRMPDGREFGIVDAICEDREGSLWLGTSEGMRRLTERRARALTKAEGLGGTLAMAVLQTRDKSLWMSTWAGGVDRLVGDQMIHLRVGSPLSYDSVTTIYEDPQGVMWFGTRRSSIDRLADGKVTTYVYGPGVASFRPVTSLFQDNDGTMLIGISRRGLLELRDGEIRVVPEAADLNTSGISINRITRLRNGELVACSSAGVLIRAPDRRWISVPIPGVTGTVSIRDLHEDDDGTRWLATDGSGLIRWSASSARAFTVSHGLVDNVLTDLLDDAMGSLWVSSPKGITRIRKSEFLDVESGKLARVNPLRIGRADGAPAGSSSGSGSPESVRLADGRLMFATNKGFAIIDPNAIPVNTQPPSVVIEGLRADGQRVDVSAEPLVAAGTRRLEIRYTALSLIAPERIRFRYKLEGFDTQWTEAGGERSAYYTHLGPGKYTFRVTACNNDGVWNETGASIAFRMGARFYQTLWFRVLSGTLLMSLIAGGFGLRFRQLKKREEGLARINAELDQRVHERTAELSRSNEELAQRESLFRLIFEHAPVGVSWHRTDQGERYHYNAAFRRILDLEGETLPDNSQIAALTHPDDAPRHLAMEKKLNAGEIDSYTLEQRFVRRDGKLVWGLLAAAVVRDTNGKAVQVIGLLEDITARKQAEEELVRTHKRLLEASRMAGMAEVASGVLHDVGNVLNSANVSASLLVEALRRSRSSGIAKVGELLSKHSTDLADFLTNDERGRRIPHYLSTLAEHLNSEHANMLQETQALRAKVEHISEIVARQQGFAQLSGLFERLPPIELIEDALRMNELGLARHGAIVERDFETVPDVLAERHKVLQILINLIKNAKQAVDTNPEGQRHIRIKLQPVGEAAVSIAVSDNGIGIKPEHLTRVFEHGFTTRPNGHGFGLHSSANAAREMRGTLSVESDGPGCGAVFTLILPVAPTAKASDGN